MRIVWALLICGFGLKANTLEVSAKAFTSDLKKGITELNGEVLVIRGEDRIWADKVVIQTNKKNQPQKYTATGNVRFYAKFPDKEVRGQAKKAIYDAQKNEYQLIDGASIQEVGQKNTLTGNLIVFNMKTQEASVKGSSKKPSVMTFIMEDSKKSLKDAQ